MSRKVTVERKTKETDIKLALDLSSRGNISISTTVPFFDHMLTSMAFHGGFSLTIEATGDIEVDPHHVVEDVGLVFGDALFQSLEFGAVMRYGHSVIPMDEALSEVTIDVCKRPYLVYMAEYPQTHSGNFDMSLFREFFQALANRAQVNLHANCRYGHNAHHMSEALFKALGKTINQSYTLVGDDLGNMSTKGAL